MLPSAFFFIHPFIHLFIHHTFSCKSVFHYVNICIWHKCAAAACSCMKKRRDRQTFTVRSLFTFSDICSDWALHKSEQAASSSSDRFEDDCAVRTSINKIHYALSNTTHTNTGPIDEHCSVWHKDEWHTSVFPSPAPYGALRRGLCCKVEPSQPHAALSWP